MSNEYLEDLEYLENQIKDSIGQNNVGKKFFILINNEPMIRVNTNTSKYEDYHRICLAVQQPKYGGNLLIGSAKEINEQLELPEGDSSTRDRNFIIDKLMKDDIYGVRMPKNRQLVITFNPDFGIINIQNRLFSELFNIIYVQGNLNNMRLPDGVSLNSEIVNKLYREFDYHSMINHKTLVNLCITKHLKNYRGPISFYTTLPVWIPMFIKGNCFFNPLLESKKNAEIITNTKLYREACRHTVTHKQLTYMFVTDKTFSECLKLPKTFRGRTDFNYSLVCGLLNERMPRKDVYYYTNGRDKISIEEYERESKKIQGFYDSYRRLSSLQDLCTRHRLSGYDVATLFNIVKNAELEV